VTEGQTTAVRNDIVAESSNLGGLDASFDFNLTDFNDVIGVSRQNPAPVDLKFVSWSSKYTHTNPKQRQDYACRS